MLSWRTRQQCVHVLSLVIPVLNQKLDDEALLATSSPSVSTAACAVSAGCIFTVMYV